MVQQYLLTKEKNGLENVVGGFYELLKHYINFQSVLNHRNIQQAFYNNKFRTSRFILYK